jgi:hypothetical protein
MVDLADSKDRLLTALRVAQKTPPTWLKCELCERTASASLPRLVAAFARSEDKAFSEHGALVLLCCDCHALIHGEIDESEWRLRVGANEQHAPVGDLGI